MQAQLFASCSHSSADAFTGFFARLGYDTNARTFQTPGNLGISADSTLRPIKRIELIADREALFQVYLFELKSVTVAHTRALARALRNRAGNFLLVLTSDYEKLDFVLLERYLPPAAPGGTIGERHVGVRPRTLTVERRKPERRALRVLKRLTWTESDGFAQYDKLLAAYAVADWAEEHFNNRALFSDYYLLERLREYPEWREDPKPAFAALRALYRGTFERFARKPTSELRANLIEPVLSALGFDARDGKAGANHETPDYRLHAPGGKDDLFSSTSRRRAMCASRTYVVLRGGMAFHLLWFQKEAFCTKPKRIACENPTQSIVRRTGSPTFDRGVSNPRLRYSAHHCTFR